MKISKLALALVVMMPATAALAQDYDAAGMQAGLTMIETNVGNAFQTYNIDADPTTLTLAQLVEIVGILNDPGKSSGGESAKASIEAALRRE
ncbi:hypothetical protein [Oceaniovalibus sp. ACAM 378]|jgi:hypothetical protein|uniref:hypothetical protein n=1 Tax=Oceaniovalibus sp. ACAM 378 TaxID=2599923 RepID=UPI0011D5C155|nr:hypothetical protein [Oceaniovalibus sp. ACAM 378]TYB90308.1 hypothetical protein FQ320_05590 [Oceaniovalibus sp. ACAM 378]